MSTTKLMLRRSDMYVGNAPIRLSDVFTNLLLAFNVLLALLLDIHDSRMNFL